jgi:hypothetical protein
MLLCRLTSSREGISNKESGISPVSILEDNLINCKFCNLFKLHGIFPLILLPSRSKTWSKLQLLNSKGTFPEKPLPCQVTEKDSKWWLKFMNEIVLFFEFTIRKLGRNSIKDRLVWEHFYSHNKST